MIHEFQGLFSIGFNWSFTVCENQKRKSYTDIGGLNDQISMYTTAKWYISHHKVKAERQEFIYRVCNPSPRDRFWHADVHKNTPVTKVEGSRPPMARSHGQHEACVAFYKQVYEEWEGGELQLQIFWQKHGGRNRSGQEDGWLRTVGWNWISTEWGSRQQSAAYFTFNGNLATRRIYTPGHSLYVRHWLTTVS